MKKTARIISIPRFTLFVAICTAAIIFSVATLMNVFGMYYAEAQSIDPYYETVKVQSGDTLWDIAEEFYPAGTDIRQAIYSIEKANHMSSSVINAGQTLQMPVWVD